jgi:hypothetical protein
VILCPATFLSYLFIDKHPPAFHHRRGRAPDRIGECNNQIVMKFSAVTGFPEFVDSGSTTLSGLLQSFGELLMLAR